MNGRGVVLAIGVFAAAAPPSAPAQGFFASDSVVAITIRADLRTLFRDRNPDTSIWREGTLGWTDAGGPRTVRVRLRTRGIFRLRHCNVPPIRLRFDGDSVRGTPWEGLRRPKLATHCMDRDDYEQYVLQEYAIYKVLRHLTPAGYSARLVRVTWEDAAGGMRPVTRYGFITEDPDRFAERMGGAMVDSAGVRFSRLPPLNAAFVGTFEYFIANTDWSLLGQHNIELLRHGDSLMAVPYDFDWSGTIGASYARPAAQLPIRNVRERIWRGMCQPLTALEPVFVRFEAARDSINAVYRAVPGLEPRLAERAVRFYDDFYRAIADRPRFMRRVVEPDCIP